MNKCKNRYTINRVDVQTSIFTAVIVILSCLAIYGYQYKATYDNMIKSLEERTMAVHNYVESLFSVEAFNCINNHEDMDSSVYSDIQKALYNVKQAADIEYLYTAKQTEDGSFVYVVDGLDPKAPDFRQPGDAIEEEIIPELERALSGEMVLPDRIKDTYWGKIFIAYLPVHDEGQVIGVLGVEFTAESQYDAYRAVRMYVPIIIILACLSSALFAVIFFRRVSNPLSKDLYNTDYLTHLKNRNAFETDLNNLGTAKRRLNVGIAAVDLNDLKKVNDTMGHDAGDTYLSLAALFLKQKSPEKSVIYRVGGDEFTVVVMEAEADRMEELTKCLMDSFGDLTPDGWQMKCSLSAGYAVFDPDLDQNVFNTCSRADQAMYLEKKRYHEKCRQTLP